MNNMHSICYQFHRTVSVSAERLEHQLVLPFAMMLLKSMHMFTLVCHVKFTPCETLGEDCRKKDFARHVTHNIFGLYSLD